MATAESVKGKIQALTAKVNEKIGANDTTLTGAVDRMLANYTGFNINGAVRQYKVQAGANVTVGDFVEFIQDWGSATIAGKTDAVSAVALSDTKVLIAYADEASASYKAVVLDVDAAEAGHGSPLTISATPSQTSISVAALTETKALVTYRNASGYGTAEVLSLSGRQLTKGASVTFTSVNTHDIQAVALSENKAFVTYRLLDSKFAGYAQVLTVTGMNVASGTAKKCNENVRSTRAAVLTARTLVIALDLYDWSASTPMGSLAKVVTIGDDGVTISVGSGATMSSYGVDQVAVAALTPDTAVVIYRELNANAATPYAALIRVLTNTVRKESSVSLSSFLADQLGIVALDARRALAIKTVYTNRAYESSAFELIADGVVVEIGKSTQTLTSSNATAITHAKLVGITGSSALFIGNVTDDTGTVDGLIYRGLSIGGEITASAFNTPGGTSVQRATNKGNVGVAKTPGQAGETVDVYCVE